MKWINPKYVTRSHEDGGLVLQQIYLGEPDDCILGCNIAAHDEIEKPLSLIFPIEASRLSEDLIKNGHRLDYISDTDPVPYTEVAVHYDRFGRTYIIGRAEDRKFYVHCKLNNGHGFITEV